MVLVTETADTPFSVVSPLRRLAAGQTLYKLFSRRSVRAVLPDMFADLEVVAEHKWAAYPRFAPPERFAPFTLAPGIYYNNAWENAGETSPCTDCCNAVNSSAVVTEGSLTSYLARQTRAVPYDMLVVNPSALYGLSTSRHEMVCWCEK